MKTQIEHAQYLIEKSQLKLQKDFEKWWEEQCEINEQKQKENKINRNDSFGNMMGIQTVDNSILSDTRENSSHLSSSSRYNQSYRVKL
jgi:hypothetical protein